MSVSHGSFKLHYHPADLAPRHIHD
jgi:hypothetical protein